MKFNIISVSQEEVFVFAKEELKRYLLAIDAQTTFGADGKTIRLTLKNESESDDTVEISFKNGCGEIAGANQGALLIASYRFLRELGCVWTCPGEGGEHIPKKTLSEELLTMEIKETPSYKHRGICIEGAVSEKHAIEMLDFIPKVGMNSYFFQFFRPTTFFQRWYTHEWNGYYQENEKHTLTAEEMDEIYARLVGEMAKRGIRYHSVGHGWTCVPFGVEGEGWRVIPDAEIPESYFDVTAYRNGTRKQPCDIIPLGQNLCYSNPFVLETMSNAVVEYAKTHKTVKALHLWLGDGSNNQCECPSCKDTLPSDYYVQLLNLVDEKLTKEGLDTKIVFLLYIDLLWAPQKYTLNNPDRFLLMLAPITRTYSKTITQSVEESKSVQTQPFVRNKLSFPKSVAENLAYYNDWRKIFQGEGFLFDYHLMWDYLKDPGYMQISKTLFEDMAGLDQIGLDGMISCQASRTAFPTGLPVFAMAKALWDKTADFNRVADEYFQADFGKKANAVRAYLTKVSELFDPQYLRGEKPAESEENYQKLVQIPALVEEFKKANPELSTTSENTAWKTLALHAESIVLLSQVAQRRAKGEERKDLYQELGAYIGRVESLIDWRIDAWNYIGNFIPSV